MIITYFEISAVLICNWKNTMNSKVMTLVFITKEDLVLLGYKTRGFGANLWNGFGGKVENGESLLEGAARELKEECNLVAELNHIGCILVNHEEKNTLYIVHIFYATTFSGQITESEEMSPINWFDMNNMPYEKMWSNVPHWFSLVQKKVYFIAKFNLEEADCKYLKIIKNHKDLLKAVDNENVKDI